MPAVRGRTRRYSNLNTALSLGKLAKDVMDTRSVRPLILEQFSGWSSGQLWQASSLLLRGRLEACTTTPHQPESCSKRGFCGILIRHVRGGVRCIPLLLPGAAGRSVQTITTDVCVYGATPAGITAAIAATRMGKTAVLLEFGRHVGGMTTAGLSWTDGGKTAAGIATEFYAVVGARGFKPAAAEKQFKAMLDQAGVRVFYEQRLQSATKDGSAITQIAMENGNRFKRKIFIDATYEGDLLAMAKVSYAIGTGGQLAIRRDAQRRSFPAKRELLQAARGSVPDARPSRFWRTARNHQPVPGCSRSTGKRRRPCSGVQLPDVPGEAAERDTFSQAAPVRPRPAMNCCCGTLPAGAKGPMISYSCTRGDSNNSGGFSTDDIGASQGWPDATYAEARKDLPGAREFISRG